MKKMTILTVTNITLLVAALCIPMDAHADPLRDAMLKEQALIAQAHRTPEALNLDKLKAGMNQVGDNYISQHISNDKILKIMQSRDNNNDNNNIIVVIPDGWKR